MGEAISAKGHEMLNPDGARIFVTARTMRRLDMRHFLFRDRGTGLLAFKPRLTDLYRQMCTDHELGPDFSGPAVCVCRCRDCQRIASDIDSTPIPGRSHSQLLAEEALREAKRRKAGTG